MTDPIFSYSPLSQQKFGQEYQPVNQNAYQEISAYGNPNAINPNLQNFMVGGNTPGLDTGVKETSLLDQLSSFGDLAKGAAALFGAYTGYKQLGLAKDQFNFTKDVTNRNLGNQATVVNEQLRARQGGRNSFNGTQRAAPQVNGAPV